MYFVLITILFLVNQLTFLQGTGLTENTFAQIPVQARAPIDLLSQNTQIASGPGGILNDRTNIQTGKINLTYKLM